MDRSHSDTEEQEERGGGTRWSNRGWDGLEEVEKQGGKQWAQGFLGLTDCLSICPSISLTVSLSVWISTCQHVGLSVYIFVLLSVSISLILSVCISVCLPACLQLPVTTLAFVISRQSQSLRAPEIPPLRSHFTHSGLTSDPSSWCRKKKKNPTSAHAHPHLGPSGWVTFREAGFRISLSSEATTSQNLGRLARSFCQQSSMSACREAGQSGGGGSR